MTDSPKKTCFVIGPIGSVGSETRRDADFLLKGIIRPAVETELDLDIWRADEDSRPGMITDKVITDINDCDLVIADLSELNPNAFYELGIRHAAAKATVHLASTGTKLPFDNVGHSVIFFDKKDWASIEDAKKKLREQCRIAISDDFEVSNPVTQAVTRKVMQASATGSDKVILDLQNRIRHLEQNNESSIDTQSTPINAETIASIINDTQERLGEKYSEFSIDGFVQKLNSDEVFLKRIEKLYRSFEFRRIGDIIDSFPIPF
ncbi:hypothetical protein [Oricola sp.]|uniref:hypothetical protein n=1 Tax=Oricola sp. TaxID=1979950 RepID=UPI003BAC4407